MHQFLMPTNLLSLVLVIILSLTPLSIYAEGMIPDSKDSNEPLTRFEQIEARYEAMGKADELEVYLWKTRSKLSDIWDRFISNPSLSDESKTRIIKKYIVFFEDFGAQSDLHYITGQTIIDELKRMKNEINH